MGNTQSEEELGVIWVLATETSAWVSAGAGEALVSGHRKMCTGASKMERSCLCPELRAGGACVVIPSFTGFVGHSVPEPSSALRVPFLHAGDHGYLGDDID